MHGACASVRWLFVLGTGRSGSTTLMAMLSAVPQIFLTGENSVVPLLAQLLTAATGMGHGGDHNMGDPMFNRPDHNALHDDACSMMLHLEHYPHHEAAYRGCKLIGNPNATENEQIETKVNAIMTLFPNAVFVASFREDIERQAHSGFYNGVQAAELANATARLRATLKATGRPTFELPLEQFSPASFTRLLRWLGIVGCEYVDVLHQNSGGYHNTLDGATAKRMLKGTCELLETGPNNLTRHRFV